MRDVAQRLLATSQVVAGPDLHEAVMVSERLRIPLTRCIGVDGFASLHRRALLLAAEEVPALQSARIDGEGRLGGLERSADAAGGEAAVVLVTHLLGLLVTFIGAPLTLAMVHEAWPEPPRADKQSTPKTAGTETVR